MTEAWVVLVEAERDTAESVLAIEQLDRLLDLLSEYGPSGLWSPDRYAVQFVLEAPTPEAALITGLGRWREAAGSAGLAGWSLVRAELKTPAELEAEHRSATDDQPTTGAPTSEAALRAAYSATRQLLYCRSRAEAAAIVSELARQLGATLVGAGSDVSSALALDLSLGHGPPLSPAADEVSMARLDLEEVLPTVMLDAAQAIRLSSRRYSSSRRRSSRVSRRTTTRAFPPATNTTAGRGTLL